MLPALVRALAVPVDALLEQTAKARNKRGPAPGLAQHIERSSQLPEAKQRVVMEMLDTVLARASH
jgi:hypothetical protein